MLVDLQFDVPSTDLELQLSPGMLPKCVTEITQCFKFNLKDIFSIILKFFSLEKTR